MKNFYPIFYPLCFWLGITFLVEPILQKKVFAQFPYQFRKEISISKQKKGNKVEIWATNKNGIAVTIFFSKGEKFKNCFQSISHQGDTLPLAERVVVPAKTKKIHLFTLYSKDTICVCNAHIYHDFFRGDLSLPAYQKIFFEYPYLLPFDSPDYFMLTQGYFGGFSHAGLYALDFAMPENTPISASRSGIVLDTKMDSNEGGIAEKYFNKANFVKILHNDSTVAIYAHLRYNGVIVQKGQRVKRGQIIGYSGNTGYSSGEHLHFGVYLLKNRQSIPTKFMVGKFIMYLEVAERYRRFTGKQEKPQKTR